jgi:hypothetical protein
VNKMKNKDLENINPWQTGRGYFFATEGGTPIHPIESGESRKRYKL